MRLFCFVILLSGLLSVLLSGLLSVLLPCQAVADKLIVGSKPFTESYILAEIIAQKLEEVGEVQVERRLGLGATGIIYESLLSGQIDIYPEYTGTIKEVILKRSEQLPSTLKMSETLGFEDRYALAVTKDFASRHQISQMSDLKKISEIRPGFSHEFIKRQDGLDAMVQFYQLHFKNVEAIEHSLAFESISSGKIDLIDIYSTDSKILKFKLQVLTDDLGYFPKYDAVILYHSDIESKYPRSMKALRELESSINFEKMIELNSKVEIEKWTFAKTAAYFLKHDSPQTESDLWQRTKEHLQLVFVSLFFAILVGLPLGILARRSRWLAQIVLLTSGLLQTIPSLALLCFLIPVFGIGFLPSIIALFLYALLPIVRNTYLGLQNIDIRLIESGRTLGLTKWQSLRLIELPLASPTILAGIKLSAIINVGTATLAAFIGAGGYGALIVTGLALNNNRIILQGAIPSALLAVLVHFVFELADRYFTPKGIR